MSLLYLLGSAAPVFRLVFGLVARTMMHLKAALLQVGHMQALAAQQFAKLFS